MEGDRALMFASGYDLEQTNQICEKYTLDLKDNLHLIEPGAEDS